MCRSPRAETTTAVRTWEQKQTSRLQRVEEPGLPQGLEAWSSLGDFLNEISALAVQVELFLAWLCIPVNIVLAVKIKFSFDT